MLQSATLRLSKQIQILGEILSCMSTLSKIHSFHLLYLFFPCCYTFFRKLWCIFTPLNLYITFRRRGKSTFRKSALLASLPFGFLPNLLFTNRVLGLCLPLAFLHFHQPTFLPCSCYSYIHPYCFEPSWIPVPLLLIPHFHPNLLHHHLCPHLLWTNTARLDAF